MAVLIVVSLGRKHRVAVIIVGLRDTFRSEGAAKEDVDPKVELLGIQQKRLGDVSLHHVPASSSEQRSNNENAAFLASANEGAPA